MIKELKKTTIISTLFLTFFSMPAFAFIKVAPANWASEVVNFISAESEKITMTVQPVAEEYQSLKKGIDSIKQSADTVKKAKEKAESTIKKAGEYKDKYEKKYNEVKDKVGLGEDKEEDESKEQLYDKANNSVKELKEELKTVQKEHEDYITTEKAKRTAQIKVLEANNLQLEAMVEEGSEDSTLSEMQLQQNAETIKALNREIDELQDNDQSVSYKEQERLLQEQIDAKNEEVKQLALSLGGKAAVFLGGVVGSIIAKSKAAYSDVNDRVFIREDEEAGGDALGRIGRNRRIAAAKDTISAYVTALKVKNNIKDREEYLQTLIDGDGFSGGDVDGIKGTDELTPVIKLETHAVRVIAMRNLLDTIKLMVAEMKMVTANDLLNLPFEYEHKEQFNFDDYIFTKEDARGEKKKKSSLMGTIKSGKEALQKEINDGKKTFEEGKEKVEKAKTDYTEVKGDVEDIVSTIKGENNDE